MFIGVGISEPWHSDEFMVSCFYPEGFYFSAQKGMEKSDACPPDTQDPGTSRGIQHCICWKGLLWNDGTLQDTKLSQTFGGSGSCCMKLHGRSWTTEIHFLKIVWVSFFTSWIACRFLCRTCWYSQALPGSHQFSSRLQSTFWTWRQVLGDDGEPLAPVFQSQLLKRGALVNSISSCLAIFSSTCTRQHYAAYMIHFVKGANAHCSQLTNPRWFLNSWISQ